MNFILSILKENVAIIAIISIFTLVGVSIKTLHFDRIKHLNAIITERDLNITFLNSEIEKERNECKNRETIGKQKEVKTRLNNSLKEIKNHENKNIKTNIGNHTLIFPK